MKMELKSIGYWSLLKISFVINFVMGLVFGLFYAILLGFIVAISSNIGNIGGMGFSPDELPAFGIMVIIFPLMFGFGAAVFNTILYLILAFVYNITAKAFGGLELNLEQVQEHTQYAMPQQSVSGAVHQAQKPPQAQFQQSPPPPTPQQTQSEQRPSPTPPPPPPPVQPYTERPRDEERDEGDKDDRDGNPPEKPGI